MHWSAVAEKFDPELRTRTLAWLESLEAGAGTFGDFCLDLWEEEFCAVDSAALDPRYVGGTDHQAGSGAIAPVVVANHRSSTVIPSPLRMR